MARRNQYEFESVRTADSFKITIIMASRFLVKDLVKVQPVLGERNGRLQSGK